MKTIVMFHVSASFARKSVTGKQATVMSSVSPGLIALPSEL